MGLVPNFTTSSGSGASVGSSLNAITQAINTYVVAPIAAFGLSGFIFNAQGEDTVNLSNDITDHYTEDNKSVQDQIAVRPKRITLKGYVGELIYNGPGSSPSNINTLAEKLTSLTAFLPSITASAQQVQNAIANPQGIDFTGALGTASNIYGLVQNLLGSGGATQNQQNAYNYFKALMQSKTLCSIQTPWEFMTNMAIESLTVIQPESSQWISDFSVTYKGIRIASTSVTAQIMSAVTSAQQEPQVNVGNVTGTPTDVSTLNPGS
jgi:Dit-like tail protein